MTNLLPAPWTQFSDRLMAVRTDVFVVEQQIPMELEHDEWDEKSFHVLLEYNGRDIATGRLLPTGYIGRVCVLKEFRGQGMGKIVMEGLIEEAKMRGMNKVTLSSQMTAAPFYESLGFVKISDVYQEVDIPHVKMEKVLAQP